MRVLVFDTETTGVVPKFYLPLDKMPYIVQFAFIVYDTDTHETIQMYNKLVKLPENVNIPEGASNVHGILKEHCQKDGIPIARVIQDFRDSYSTADVVVAHNIQFDNRMVMLECERLKIKNFLVEEISYCTMKNSVKITKIITENKLGEKYYKSPKLSELHQHFFGYIPKNLHDALTDILICLRCFIMLYKKQDLCKKNSQICDLFEKLK
tara:strand:+ start:378 stop:1007 length:630 start_codon:yes stop_codon:yes gene_type:complete